MPRGRRPSITLADTPTVLNEQVPVEQIPNAPSNLIELGEKIYESIRIDPESADSAEIARKIYDTIHEVEERNRVTFVSHIRGLNIALQVYRLREDGKIIVESKVVEFYQGQYVTSDPYIIEALRREPTYGGVGDEKPSNSKSPLFWEQAFPRWKMKQIEAEESAKQKTPYEETEVMIV